MLSVFAIGGVAILGSRWLSPGYVKAARTEPIVTPGVQFFSVAPNEEHIGFASSTIDTTHNSIQVSDYFLADLHSEGTAHRAWARVVARLTPTLRLTDFVLILSPEIGPLRASGTIAGDTLLTLVVSAGNEQSPPDTQQIRLAGPTLLPNLVPLAVARGAGPRVGQVQHLNVFDPLALAPTRIAVRVVAESLFTIPDSATRARGQDQWAAAGTDTVRAWRIDGGRLISGWIDARGRLVEGTLLGLVPLQRTAYELAYTNWIEDTRRNGPRISASSDIQETTAIAASAPINDKRSLASLRVVLRDADLTGYDLRGARQTMLGDTLAIRRETDEVLRANYTIPADPAQFGATLASEPLVQSTDLAIVTVARQIAGEERDPRIVAERINQWVHDSLDKQLSFSIPNALQVLRLRAGDCNEHTQLFVALARAAGLPARSVAGLAYVGGKFYYHAWPEVYLGDWVATDPTFGQFPADAAHLRFVIGGFKRQAELLRLIGTLGIDVVSAERVQQ
ncbi:MAG: transglutaminase-like domain-containing protein [Gemmatimonadota bacterium]|nr:transglutaminase-like domain-containing protein [Gemmatimonadota bacterium]